MDGYDMKLSFQESVRMMRSVFKMICKKMLWKLTENTKDRVQIPLGSSVHNSIFA